MMDDDQAQENTDVTQPVTLAQDAVGQRLDKAIADRVEALSRVRIQQLLADGHIVEADGTPQTNPSMKISRPMTLIISLPPADDPEPQPEDIPLSIAYEDEHLLVIDKPAGMVVHPAAGHATGTLVNALLHHCGDSLSGIGGVRRPGIVHRLDKETSGLMVVAKHDQAHHGLAEQFADRSLSRRYQALVWGQPNPAKGLVDAAIARHAQQRKKMTVVEQGGKPARTHYKTLAIFKRMVTLVECRLETGRTHQIRVHMASIGHPLLGDRLYGDTRFARRQAGLLPDDIRAQVPRDRQALHAYHLEFTHPLTKRRLEYTSTLPRDITLLIEQLQTM